MFGYDIHMEFSARHHDTLIHSGIDRELVSTQAPLLADTMRKIVHAILEWKKHVHLSSYNKEKKKESKKEKKFPLPNVKGVDHTKRKKLSKDAFHDALRFRKIDLKRDRIAAACREIKAEYVGRKIYPEKKIFNDAKTLVWAYFLFRKTDGAKAFFSTMQTVQKNPNTWALESSNIISTLKSVLQSIEYNPEINRKEFMKKLSKYMQELMRQQGWANEKK